jgi:hypothetical protein
MVQAPVLGALHALALTALAWSSASHLTANSLQRLCAIYILIWCNLVYTALVLSVFSALDRVLLYFVVSLTLAVGVDLLLHWRHIVPVSRGDDRPNPRYTRYDAAVLITLAAVLAVAALSTALICIRYIPNNPDTCTYRLSRAFFYLARGNLLHTGNPGDPRLSFYPFNGTLLNLFVAMYQWPAQWFNLVPALAWVFAGIGTYSMARSLGGSGTGSLVAAWVCLMSPAILVQAASGNDEVLAAAPILIGLGFGSEWLSTGRTRYALLAGIGIGLGAGTKLHWIFYSVFACLVAFLFLFRLIRRADLRKQWARRIPGAIAAAAIAAPLVCAFIVCNYISTRQITATSFNNLVLNTPFRLSLAREKLHTSTEEMLLSPIPDLVPPVHPVERQRAYAAFNRFFMKCCAADLVQVTKRSPEGYIFQGPADQYGYLPVEQTVWLGFLPHFLILIGLVQIFTRRLPLACIALVAGFLFWHVTYAAQTKYIWWVCTYYSFPAVLAIAALALVWDYSSASRTMSARVLLGAFVALFATHTLLAANLLAFGGARNIQFLWPNRVSNTDVRADAPVKEAIRAARRVYIPDTHWEVPYWRFMRFNPVAKYTTGGGNFRLPSPDILMLLPVQPDVAAGLLPARIPPGEATALTYLGDTDNDHVFAQGDGIETRYADRSRYTLIQVNWRRDASTGGIAAAQSVLCCVGLQPSDGVVMRYALQNTATGTSVEGPWLRPGQLDTDAGSSIDGLYDTFLIEIQSTKHPDRIARTMYRLGQAAYTVGTTEPAESGAPSATLAVNIPSLAPEPYELHGKHYAVSWLKEETSFSVVNPGKQSTATVEMHLAVAGRPHTAVLLTNGREVRPRISVSKVFWDSGAQTVGFEVTLAPGENKFILKSKEAADMLPDGRAVGFLLIGNPAVTPLKEPQ